MKDIRTYISAISPLIFKDEVNFMFIEDNQYLAYSLTGLNLPDYVFDKAKEKDFYTMTSEIILPIVITIDCVEIDGKSTNYLIAWFDNSSADFQSANYSSAFVGISQKDINLEFAEEYEDVDDYVYLKSAKSISKKKIQKFIQEQVFLLDKVPLEKLEDKENMYYRRLYHEDILDMDFEKENQNKIAIPNEIQPVKQSGFSHIRIAKLDLQNFNGNSVYPFVWIEKTELKRKGEK